MLKMSFYLSLLLMCLPLHAGDVYKSRDANGNVIFSDMPSPNAKKHEVKELPTMPAVVVPLATPVMAKPVEDTFTYTSLSVVAPQSGFQVAAGYAGSLEVHGVLSPALRDGDIVVMLDGNDVVGSGRQTAFHLNNLERGEHRLQMVVRDAKGKVLISSNTVIVYVQRSSVLKRAN